MATKTTTKKPPSEAKAAAPRKTTSAQRKAPLESSLQEAVSDDELRGLIAETAYYKAQQRGFQPGYEQRDWLEAEAEVMSRLGIRP
jgi:hypothetical protein